MFESRSFRFRVSAFYPLIFQGQARPLDFPEIYPAPI
jgi:hypothetical protein